MIIICKAIEDTTETFNNHVYENSIVKLNHHEKYSNRNNKKNKNINSNTEDTISKTQTLNKCKKFTGKELIEEAKKTDDVWKLNANLNLKLEPEKKKLSNKLDVSIESKEFKIAGDVDVIERSKNKISFELPINNVVKAKASLENMLEKVEFIMTFYETVSLKLKKDKQKQIYIERDTDYNVLAAEFKLLKILNLSFNILEDIILLMSYDQSAEASAFMVNKCELEIKFKIQSFKIKIKVELKFDGHKFVSQGYKIVIENMITITISLDKLLELFKLIFQRQTIDLTIPEVLENLSLKLDIMKHLEKHTSSKAKLNKVKNTSYRLNTIEERKYYMRGVM